MIRVLKPITYSDPGRRLLAILVMSAAAVVIASGCAQQQQSKAIDTAVAQILLSDANKATVIEASEDVLARMHFAIEKSDPDAGLLRTLPLSGAQFFELWRSDNAGAFNTAESNLHSLRRTVELQISNEGPGKTRVICRVHTERLDIPEQQHVTSSGRAYFMFSKSSQSTQKLELNPEQQEKMQWVDMGRDARLEMRILSRIKDAVITSRQSTVKPKTAEQNS